MIVCFGLIADAVNVPKTDVENHHHHHHDDDTIDARLRAKHDLRKSIHEHSDPDVNDRQETEEDCMNNVFALSTQKY